MTTYDVKEKDWKLFRARLPEWQENYMARLCKEYFALLSEDKMPSSKFWALEKRINADRKSVGVCVQTRRSMMELHIRELLHDGVIELKDLEGFSEELIERVRILFEMS